MTMHVAIVLESQEPIAEIGDHFTMERTNQHLRKILNQCWAYNCQLSRCKQFLFSAGCLIDKNVLKLEAGMLEKIRTF